MNTTFSKAVWGVGRVAMLASRQPIGFLSDAREHGFHMRRVVRRMGHLGDMEQLMKVHRQRRVPEPREVT